MIAQTRKFFAEVKTELAKATWPWDLKEKGVKRYKELTDSTTVVVIGTLILSAVIASADFILNTVFSYLTK